MSTVGRPLAATLHVGGAALLLWGLVGCEGPPLRQPDASFDGNTPDSPYVRPDGSISCTTDPDCDDGVPCTRDSCNPLGFCSTLIDHEVCQDDLYCNGRELCNVLRGCEPGPRESCDDGMVCTVDRCDEATKTCVREARDLDMDGDVDFFCGDGTDCDDRDATVSGMAPEICEDFVDNDCDDAIDEATCGRAEHDVCASALAITGPGSYTLDLRGASADYALRCTGLRPDVVMTLTLDEPQDVTVTADSDTFTTILALRGACDDVATETECLLGFPSTIRRRALPAGTYFLILAGFGTGEAVVTVDLAPPTEAPTNESCTTPIVIPETGGHYESSLVDVVDDHAAGCGSGGDLVYTFTTTEVRDVRIDARAVDGQQMSWAVGTTCGSAVGQTRCTVGGPAGGTLHELPAGTYFLVLEGPTYVEVDFVLDVAFLAPTPPRTGDQCDDPIPLVLDTPYMGTLVGSEDDYDTTCGFHYRDVVHSFTLTEPSDVTITMNGGVASYMNASIRSACDMTGSQLRCDAGSPSRSRIRGLAAGTYYVLVESGLGGSYMALVTTTTPPSTPVVVMGNDGCGGAFSIPPTGGLFTGDSTLALSDYAPLLCGSSTVATDVVFRLDLGERRLVTASTDGSSYDTVLYMYSGGCGAGRVETLCNDDGGGAGGASLLSTVLEPGAYFFVVDGFSGASGDYVFEIFVTEP